LAAALVFTVYWAGVPGLTGQSALLTACTALVLTFLVFRPAQRLTETRAVSWLGRRSFSLYLVHEPVLVSAALLTPIPFRFLGITAGVVLAFFLTAAFYRWVEAPSQRASSAVGRWVASKVRATPRVVRSGTWHPDSQRRPSAPQGRSQLGAGEWNVSGRPARKDSAPGA